MITGKIEVEDINEVKHILTLKDLGAAEIIATRGGKILIQSLLPFPPLECKWEDCYELAEYSVIVVDSSRNLTDPDDLITFCCQEHKDEIKRLGYLEIPLCPTLPQ